ncbi:MAG TPA: hypothetical protein VNW92_01600, partial [Polyangiaceae bacterium]|nr:hypothetical protein [Polyangiaceae bacterium]
TATRITDLLAPARCTSQKAPSGAVSTRRTRADSDEAYVLDLCDAILGEPASRQHRFDWLVGDPGRNGRGCTLPVDAYYAAHRLVVEYRERQHDEPVTHFDKPDVLTVSGVHRGIQRGIYDERRTVEIPAHGLRLIVVKSLDLAADRRGRLLRIRERDEPALRTLLLGETGSYTA